MYSYYQKQLYNDRDELQAAIQKGREDRNREIAKAMLADGDSIERVMKITGLSAVTINKIKP